MSDSTTQSPPTTPTATHDTTLNDSTASQIPIEIVSEEEMNLIEAALACVTRSPLAAASSSSVLSSSQFRCNVRSIGSISMVAKRRLSGCTESGGLASDIEDSGGFATITNKKRNKMVQSLFDRFRRTRGLTVTDFTSSEWCEKQKEFELHHGRPAMTEAMKKGTARHAVLEEEVVKKVKVRVEAREDIWGLKIMNFIIGANQLLFDGLTRELPIIGFVEGVWMVGAIDELRMLETNNRNPILVDTKTRVQATLPSEPQQRNGRLQLMCYKYLWDSLVSENFPSRQFLDFFSLDSNHILSEEIRDFAANSGFPAHTLDDLMRCFKNASSALPLAHEHLLLRYELQEDNSLLGEHQFLYDSDWVKNQINHGLQFWLGEREATYAPKEERWKCRSCQFASVCPVNDDRQNKSD